jgi:hypothetical protein
LMSTLCLLDFNVVWANQTEWLSFAGLSGLVCYYM